MTKVSRPHISAKLYFYHMKFSPLFYSLIAFVFISLASTSAVGQNTLTLDKGGKVKRLHFFQNDNIRLKLVSGEKISGQIEYIYDTAFVINGRAIQPVDVYQVYTSRKALKWIGGLFITGGLFYAGIEMANNAINSRGYLISEPVAIPLTVTLGAGGLMLLFSTRKTKVAGTNKFKILNTTPIPIQE